MYSKLINLKENKNIVAIYSNDEQRENFMVGYICDVKNDKVLILNVGIHGEYDGYTGIYIDDIFRLETNSKYLDKINKLKSFDEKEFLNICVDNDVFEALITISIMNHMVVAVLYGDDIEIRGYAKENNGFLKILELDEYGEADGENLIKTELISRISIDDVECRDIKKLSDYRNIF